MFFVLIREYPRESAVKKLYLHFSASSRLCGNFCLMRGERMQAIGLVVVALIILAVVLIRYGRVLPWGAK